jgi:dephospho-CoA kinase
MTSGRPILRAGLTGGIASGKSTVSGFFAGLGAFVLDADELARQAMSPGGAAHESVLRRFGDGMTRADGSIDRPRLAARVFGDPAELAALNEIVHPAVRAEAARRFERCAETGRYRVGVLDAALLVETGYYGELDRLIVLRCSPDTQRARLRARPEIPPGEAAARLAVQAPLERKLAVADYVIDTEASLEETRRQTELVWAALLSDYEAMFTS